MKKNEIRKMESPNKKQYIRKKESPNKNSNKKDEKSK